MELRSRDNTRVHTHMQAYTGDWPYNSTHTQSYQEPTESCFYKLSKEYTESLRCSTRVHEVISI